MASSAVVLVTLAQASTSGVPWAAIAPIILLAVGFVAYCRFDLTRAEVRYLPTWAWALICVFSVPMGGIVYLLVGREPGSES